MTREEREEYWRGVIASRRPWGVAQAFVAALEERDNLLRKVVSFLDGGEMPDTETESNIRELLGEHA